METEDLVPPGPAAVDYSMEFGWESRYVSEGRSNLGDDGLVSTTAEASLKALTVGACYLSSPDTDYTELNLGAELSAAFGDWEGYVGFTHLAFLADDGDDNEVGGGLACTALPAGLAVGLDGYYSFEAEGTFLEASLGGDYAVLDWLSLSPAVAMGFNAGYVADGHDGANHVAATLGAVAELKDGVALEGYVAYTWGIDADAVRHAGDEPLEDAAMVGLALRCE